MPQGSHLINQLQAAWVAAAAAHEPLVLACPAGSLVCRGYDLGTQRVLMNNEHSPAPIPHRLAPAAARAPYLNPAPAIFY